MAKLNKIKQKKVTIELDKERTLYYDLNSFAELEDKFGDIQGVMKAMEAGSIKAIRSVLWAGLIHEDPTITEREVGALVSFDNLELLGSSIGEALVTASPDIAKAKN